MPSHMRDCVGMQQLCPIAAFARLRSQSHMLVSHVPCVQEPEMQSYSRAVCMQVCDRHLRKCATGVCIESAAPLLT